MKIQVKNLLFSLCVLSCLSTLEGGASVDYLDESTLFEISWPGKQKVLDKTSLLQDGADVSSAENDDGEREGPVLVQKLPNELLGQEDEEEEGSMEPVVLVTAERERYSCVLPTSAHGGSNEDEEWANMDALDPKNLLKPLQEHCMRLVMGYWNYELCIGKYVRQFHEEKYASGQPPKVDEYYLGKVDKDGSTELGSEIESYKQGERLSKEVPTWHFNGLDYPYYEVVMGGGTPCKLMSGEPRVTRVMFICDKETPPVGMFLNIEEVTTCRYEAVVSTRQLCQNKAYRLKESPVHTINCFAQDDSPRRPRILLEHELATRMASKPKADTIQPPPPRMDTTPVDVSLDSRFVETIMTGEMCLRGGAGWWQHELCFGQHVKQIHTEGGITKTALFLGFWDEEKHKEWFANAGKKKQSKTHVTNLYVGGDICDVTGVARQCQVRFRCLKTSKSSQISLYLEEPTTCSYILTVEGSFVCPLLDTTDEYGIIHYREQTFREKLEDSEEESSSD